ncbi:hypothetical protein BCR33DRAFT_325767 [Rhizoclosmatium globosum]|uniref:Uncharacterized protein n=1 Tax=Rhizoclosmatium globosum TaxID=329046 RepID=A0A1Y2D297_9FUNG|nr:hypothetical protein BCR33DRAFT_325767 [Rhizoclosmatium globosum]|eukprot:ORY52695.1 hypothetical protein BCR33DRAFT_325767 [Rhizoclosmatium globosum]
MCPIKRVACIKKPSIKEYWPTFQEVFGSGVTCWSDDTTPMDYEALPRLIAAQSKQPTATKPIRSPTPEPLSTKHILPTTSKPKTKKGRKHNRRK